MFGYVNDKRWRNPGKVFMTFISSEVFLDFARNTNKWFDCAHHLFRPNNKQIRRKALQM